MNKFYLLSFDPHLSHASAMHDSITGCPYINDWWHYLSSTYIISSTYTLGTITNYLGNKLSNPIFLLIEVDLNNANGYLGQPAWNWINQHK